MTPLLVLAVAVAGGIGSALRYLTDNCLPVRIRRAFPWGTVIVNLVGSFLLGVVSGAATTLLPHEWITILSTGLLGGYTTFSTASLETVRLLHDRRHRAAAFNGLGVLAVSVALATLGYAISAY